MRPLVPLSDEELVECIVQSQDSSLVSRASEVLLRRYQSKVYAWCLRYIREPEAAKDLSQEILLKIHRALPTFAGRSRVSTWVFAVTRNECISASRRRTIDAVPEDILDEFPDPSSGPDEALLHDEAESRLLKMIEDELEPMEQEAVWMRGIDRLPIDEITRLLGLESASGARGLLQTARRKLRAARSAARRRE